MINKVTQKKKKIYKEKIKFKVLDFSKHDIMILHYCDVMTLHLETFSDILFMLPN